LCCPRTDGASRFGGRFIDSCTNELPKGTVIASGAEHQLLQP
jgi:hypothetical protein